MNTWFKKMKKKRISFLKKFSSQKIRFGIGIFIFLILVIFIFGSDSNQSFVEELLSNDSRISRKATKELQMMTEEEQKVLLPYLIDVLEHSDLKKCDNAVNTLGLIGPCAEEAIPSLIKMFKKTDPELRANTAWALSEIGLQSIPPLLITLQDRNPDVKMSVLLTFETMGSRAKQGIPSIIIALSDPNPHVRTFAASALGKMGEYGKEALSALKIAMTDEDRTVQSAAIYAVNEIEEALKAKITEIKK